MITGAEGAPVPPPGPGVQVPFPAPPSERDRRRLWIGLGVGGALLALCCVGGIFGVGALVVQTGRSLLNEATTVVSDYLGGLRDARYDAAYDQLCGQLQARTSRSEFADAQRALSPVASYSVGTPSTQGSAVLVPASVTRDDGEQETLDFRLVRDSSQTTDLKICSID